MRLRIMALVAVLAAGAACDHSPEATLAPSRDLRGAPTPELPAPELAGWSLRSHADYDALEAAFDARASLPDLGSLLLALAAKRQDDALLLTRTALLWLDGPAGQRSLQTVFDLADRVRVVAPDTPDTRYLLLAVKRVVVWNVAARSVSLMAGQEDVARRYVGDVRALVAAAPDYAGPKGVSAASLSAEADAIQRSLDAPRSQDDGVAILPDGEPLPTDQAALWSAWARFVEALDQGGTKAACLRASDVLDASPPADLAAAVEATCGGAGRTAAPAAP